jgi:hypothetical protein
MDLDSRPCLAVWGCQAQDMAAGLQKMAPYWENLEPVTTATTQLLTLIFNHRIKISLR